MTPCDHVGAVLRRQDGRVLLGLHGPEHGVYPGRWNLFGGPVEAGESAADAVSRELSAQLGVHPLTARPLVPLERAEGRFELFVVEAWTGEPAIADAGHVAIRWFQPTEAATIPALAHEVYRDPLSTLAAGS
jgi:ADP-ribose pyrophosphatase YjhB (NUDIX family)